MAVTIICCKYFLSLFILLGIMLAVGDFVVSTFADTRPAKRFYTRLFTRLLTGITTCVFFYAVVSTSGKTIEAGFIVLLLPLVFFRLRKSGCMRLTFRHLLL